MPERRNVRKGSREVVTVLSHHREGSQHVRKLIGYIQGGVHLDSLEWEDIATPMKLTGGRVCLKLIDNVGPFYVSYEASGDLQGFVMDRNNEPLRDMPAVVSPFEVNRKIDMERWDVELVLEKNTPFGENDE